MAYHHGNLRSALLEAALGLARDRGPGAIGMREVTRRTGVTVNAAYRHFADLDALLVEVGELAMEELSRAIVDRIEQVPPGEPGEQARLHLRAVGEGYVGYGLREPGLFDAAFHRTTGGAPVEEAHPFQLLCSALDRLVEVGAMPGGRRGTAPIECWSAVHGFVVLHRGPLADLTPSEVDHALTGLLDTLEHGLLQTPPPEGPPGPEAPSERPGTDRS